MSQITINQGYTNPLLGFSAVSPGTAGRRRISVVGHDHQAHRQPHDQGRDRGRAQQGLPAPGPGRGRRRAGSSSSTAPRPPSPPTARPSTASPTPSPRSCSTCPATIQRDIKVIDQPGTEHWRVFAFVQDKWQVTQKLTVDLGLRWEYYTPLHRHRGPGRALQLRPLEQHGPGGGLREHPPERRGAEQLQELRAAARLRLPLQREDGPARRLRHHDHPVPRQPLRLQLPGQADEPAQRAELLRPRREDGERLRRRRLLPDPGQRRRGREHPAAEERRSSSTSSPT